VCVCVYTVYNARPINTCNGRFNEITRRIARAYGRSVITNKYRIARGSVMQ